MLGDLPGPKLRIGELRDDVAELETGMHVKLTPQAVEGDAETIPVDWPGVASLREDELVYLADGSIRLRVGEPEDGGVDAEVEVGGHALLPQGDEHPGGHRPRRHRRRPRLGRVRGRARDRPARDVLRLLGGGPRAGGRAAAIARLRHPADRQDREAAGGRERRGDRPRGERRDHGGARATSGSSCRWRRCRSCRNG